MYPYTAITTTPLRHPKPDRGAMQSPREDPNCQYINQIAQTVSAPGQTSWYQGQTAADMCNQAVDPQYCRQQLVAQTFVPLQQKTSSTTKPWQRVRSRWQKFSRTPSAIAMSIVYLIGMVPAAYLSWRCNTNYGFGTASKILYATVAGLFSFNYIAAYAVYKWGTCSPGKCGPPTAPKLATK